VGWGGVLGVLVKNVWVFSTFFRRCEKCWFFTGRKGGGGGGKGGGNRYNTQGGGCRCSCMTSRVVFVLHVVCVGLLFGKVVFVVRLAESLW